MASGVLICAIMAVSVMVCVGVVWNSFNLIMTIQKQLKTKSVQTMSLIIISISINNNTLVLSCFFMVVIISLNPLFICTTVAQPQYLTLLFLWMSSSCMSFWSMAWLSVFYCVKVVNFSTECLRALKRNISVITNTALMLSCVGSFILFFPFFTLHLPEAEPGATSGTSGVNNTSDPSYLTCSLPVFSPLIIADAYTVSFMSFLCPLPLAIMLPTSIRMVIYLCQHMLTLRKNQTQVQSLDSYLSVCKLNVSLAGVYLITLLIVALFFVLRLIGLNVSYLLIIFGFSFYCIMTAALLTASKTYLRRKFWSMCCCKKTQEETISEITQMTKTEVA
ncbi:taste receptor type 2 member 103-like [Pygocentrus nattereri]|uniref:taste receptor type 2 member 103-like n=1 Tax=Pygocentrus nattereri TaxID=42514 RepID=UPI00081436E0|nr:taste receptor type 2 member 103-like [Pygocentrus nattereri]